MTFQPGDGTKEAPFTFDQSSGFMSVTVLDGGGYVVNSQESVAVATAVPQQAYGTYEGEPVTETITAASSTLSLGGGGTDQVHHFARPLARRKFSADTGQLRYRRHGERRDHTIVGRRRRA